MEGFFKYRVAPQFDLNIKKTFKKKKKRFSSYRLHILY